MSQVREVFAGASPELNVEIRLEFGVHSSDKACQFHKPQQKQLNAGIQTC